MLTRILPVALRKESVDRNSYARYCYAIYWVALRKESVDRNAFPHIKKIGRLLSLSARRAWIEIPLHDKDVNPDGVALRKESVDRNANPVLNA